jgi:hypothetical protein
MDVAQQVIASMMVGMLILISAWIIDMRDHWR